MYTPDRCSWLSFKTIWDRSVLANIPSVLEFSVLTAFHTLSLLYFPLPHFQCPHQSISIRLSLRVTHRGCSNQQTESSSFSSARQPRYLVLYDRAIWTKISPIPARFFGTHFHWQLLGYSWPVAVAITDTPFTVHAQLDPLCSPQHNNDTFPERLSDSLVCMILFTCYEFDDFMYVIL